MTQHESIADAGAAADAEDVQAMQDKPTAPHLSKRAQEALKRADPLTESLLAKVLGNQVCMHAFWMRRAASLQCPSWAYSVLARDPRRSSQCWSC